MNQNQKDIVKKLWKMKNLTVEKFLLEITDHPDLKFLVTKAGVLLLLRLVIGILIGTHLIYFFCRMFNLVMG